MDRGSGRDRVGPMLGLGAASAPPLPARQHLTSSAPPLPAPTSGAPPLPARPPQSGARIPFTPAYRPYSHPGTHLAGYNRGYQGYQGYQGYPPTQNRFIQLAEESSLPAFQSIEAIVHAFGSVSMKLESTFHAVHSSFQAVLGVAEHLTKMKLQIGQAGFINQEFLF